jgi:capsid portal protein
LKSIIDGCVDYVVGDGVSILPLNETLAPSKMNVKGDTITEQVKDIAGDIFLTGGFALQVIRNAQGGIAEIHYIDMRFLRTNKECNVFYYSENWNKGGRKNVIVYPAFMPNLDWNVLSDKERNRHASSILFVKKSNKRTYPVPCYAAAIKACEMERCIDNFHLNSINNGFTSSYIINFNNGTPTDEQKQEIEDTFNEKFSGHENAGRIGFSWNPNKESATTIEKVDVDDFGEKYKSSATNSRQKIFTAFRANPNLFGIPTDSLGFSQEEYESSFRLFNRTMIRPVQMMIADAYDKIYGRVGVLTITPFSMEESATEKQVN